MNSSGHLDTFRLVYPTVIRSVSEIETVGSTIDTGTCTLASENEDEIFKSETDF